MKKSRQSVALSILLLAVPPLGAQDATRDEKVDAEVVRQWGRRLEKAGPLERHQLLEKLVTVGDRVGPAVPMLIPLLDDRLFSDQVLKCLNNAGRLAVPHLIARLATAEHDPKLRIRERRILLNHMDCAQAAIPELAKLLLRVLPRQRREIGVSLGRFGRAATPHLLHMLKSEDGTVRVAALTGLGASPDVERIGHLRAVLKDPDAAVRLQAMLDLRNIAPGIEELEPAAAVDFGMREIRGNSSRDWAGTLRFLGRTRDPGIVPRLLYLSPKVESYIQEEIVLAIAAVGEKAIPTLAAAVRSEQAWRRERAVIALGMLLPATREEIKRLANGRDPVLARRAVCALRRRPRPVRWVPRVKFTGVKIEKPPADPLLHRLARMVSPDPQVRNRAASEGWKKRNRPSARALAAAMDHPEEAVRFGAVRSVGFVQTRREELIPALVRRLRDKPRIRSEAAVRLSYLRMPLTEFAQQLVDALPIVSPLAQLQLLQSLALMGAKGKPALAQTLRLLDDGTVEVATQACLNLGSLARRTPEVTAALLRATRHRVGAIRAGAARTLGGLKVPVADVEGEILPLLDDENTSVRNAAAVYLCGTEEDRSRLVARFDAVPKHRRAPLLGAILHASGRSPPRVEPYSHGLRGFRSKPRPQPLARPLLEEAMRICPAPAQMLALSWWLNTNAPADEARPILEWAVERPNLSFAAAKKLAEIDPSWPTVDRLRRLVSRTKNRSRAWVPILLGMGPQGVQVAIELVGESKGSFGLFDLTSKLATDSIPMVLDLAKKGPVAQRTTAIDTLGVVGQSTSPKPTSWSSHEPDPTKRVAAIFEHMKAVIPVLVSFLDGEEPRITEASARALQRIGHAAHPALVPRLYQAARRERVRAFLMLTAIGYGFPTTPKNSPPLPQSSVPLVAAGLRDPLPYYQVLAMRRLSALAVPDRRFAKVRWPHRRPPQAKSIAIAIPELMNIVADKKNPQRVPAIMTLRDAGPDAVVAVPLLIEAMGDENWRTSQAATVALGAFQAAADRILPEFWRELRRGLPRQDNLRKVCDAACSLGPKAMPLLQFGLARGWADMESIVRMSADASPLIHLLGRVPADDDKKLADLVAICLPRMSDAQKARAIEVLKRRVGGKAEQHVYVTKLLQRLGAASPVDVTKHIEILSQKKWQRQMDSSLRVLGDLGPAAKAATDVLILRVDGDQHPVHKAIEVLGKMHADSADDEVERVLTAIGRAFDRQKYMKSGNLVSRALVRIGRRAIPHVVRMILSGDKMSRVTELHEALHALGQRYPEPLVAQLEKRQTTLGQHRRPVLEMLARSMEGRAQPRPLIDKVIALLELEPDIVIEGLGHLGRHAVPRLSKLLDADDDGVVHKSLMSLARVGPVAVDSIPSLLSLARRSGDFRLSVAQGLLQMGTRGAIALEELALDAKDWAKLLENPWYLPNAPDRDLRWRGYVRALATAAMKHGPEVLITKRRKIEFRTFVGNPDRETRRWAEIGAAVQDEAPRAEKYVESLVASQVAVRRFAARQIHKLITPAMVPKWLPTLALSLEDEDPVVRAEMAGAIGKLGSVARATLPVLRDHLQDTEAPVQTAVEAAMRAIEKR